MHSRVLALASLVLLALAAPALAQEEGGKPDFAQAGGKNADGIPAGCWRKPTQASSGNFDFADPRRLHELFGSHDRNVKALERPRIVHLHDWQTALGAGLLRHERGEDPCLRGARSVFTIHNLAYQGLFPRERLPGLGLPWEAFERNSRAIREEYSCCGDEEYRAGHAKVLRSFFDRPRLYLTDRFEGTTGPFAGGI